MSTNEDGKRVTNASVLMMAGSKPAPIEPSALVVSSEEALVGNTLDVLNGYMQELQRRRREGSLTAKDVALATQVAKAGVSLAAEKREQAKQNSLALNSDEDIVKLLIDAIRSLGTRGSAILAAAAQRLEEEKKAL